MGEHYWQISQIARYLEIPESTVRELIKVGDLPPIERRGQYGSYLVNFADVQHYARVMGLGELGRRQRLVLLVGNDLDETELALTASGLTTERAPSILAAVSQHDVAGAPIVVASAAAVAAELPTFQERHVLEELSSMMFLAVIAASVTDVPWEVERRAYICDPWEHRRLILWAWHALENRHAAGSLDLAL